MAAAPAAPVSLPGPARWHAAHAENCTCEHPQPAWAPAVIETGRETLPSVAFRHPPGEPTCQGRPLAEGHCSRCRGDCLVELPESRAVVPVGIPVLLQEGGPRW
eukprot:9644679-Heterocapsa_arctica.AAC.1